MDYASELNPEQLAVVMHPAGAMLVLAGAGSGKTRTLVYRVARFLEDGIEPGAILLLTFTNRAAREMLSRVGLLLGRDAGRVTGGTFHSVGNRLLRRYGDRLGYPSNYGILDREDSRDLMATALADVVPSTPNRRLPGGAVLVEIYSFVINTGRPLEEVVSTSPENTSCSTGSCSSAATTMSAGSWPRASVTSWSTSTRTRTASRPTSSISRLGRSGT